MGTVVLLFLVIILGVACVILAVFLIEGRKLHGNKPIRAWRIAWSKRKQINQEKLKASRAKQEAMRARDEADRAVRLAGQTEQLAKQKIDENFRISNETVCKIQDMTEKYISRMGSYIIAEQSGEHIKAIKANNYHAKEKKILRSIEVASKNGYHLPVDEQRQLTRMLKQAHEKALRLEAEKQKQAEIKEQIREEDRAQREFDRAIKKAEEERKEKEREAKIRRRAMEDAIKMLGDTHSEQLDELKKQLADAEQEAEEARLAAERTKSMAQQTKRGHIYIISNIGSFGKDMYKVGMTRRLEPMDRVKELGDASVPFTFDIHAMILSDNEPSLESALHRRLNDHRVNRVNYRKEYFRTSIETIIQAVEAEHGVVEYQADPEALEYFESIQISNESDSLEDRMMSEASLEEQD